MWPAGPNVAPSATVGTVMRSRRPDGGGRPSRDSRSGMGLVEVVIAVGLLVTLAAGVVHLFAMSARSIARARHRTSSLMLAVDKLEQLRAGVRTPGTATGPLETRGEQTEYLDTAGRLVGRGRPSPAGIDVRARVVGRCFAGIERCAGGVGDGRPDPAGRWRWRARPGGRAGWSATGHAAASAVIAGKRDAAPV